MALQNTLEALEHGALLDDLEAEFLAAAERALTVAKPASVTLTIKVVPIGQQKVEILTTLTSKLPQADRETTPLFLEWNDNNQPGFSRYDPRQPAIPQLKEFDRAE